MLWSLLVGALVSDEPQDPAPLPSEKPPAPAASSSGERQTPKEWPRQSSDASTVKPAPAPRWGFEAQFGFGSSGLNLANTAFRATGQPETAGDGAAFSANGGDLGFETPRFWTFELGVHYLRRYFFAGPFGFFAPKGSPDRSPDPRLLHHVGDVMLYGVGAEAGAAIPFRPWTLRLSLVGGARFVRGPVTGYQPETCNLSRRRVAFPGTVQTSTTYPCAEHAVAITGFLQPRVAIDVAPFEKVSWLSIGAFFGLDVLPGVAWSAGGALTVRTQHWMMAARDTP